MPIYQIISKIFFNLFLDYHYLGREEIYLNQNMIIEEAYKMKQLLLGSFDC